MMSHVKIIFFCFLFCASEIAYAARPFVTDDARLTSAGSCQVETWARVYRASHEFWALPACNFMGNLEFTLGGSIAKNDGEPSSNDIAFQLKTLLRTLSPNGWGLGFAAGVISHPDTNPGPNQFGNTYIYLPSSFSLWDDRLIAHISLGMLHDKAGKFDSTTWGVGLEAKINEYLLAISEMYGDSRNNPYTQIGFRYSIKSNLLQIDATVGTQLEVSADNTWISVGLRYTPSDVLAHLFGE